MSPYCLIILTDKLKKLNIEVIFFVQIVSAALGVEFDNAFVKVDFEEIEAGKKSALKWRKWREKRKNMKAQAS